jgi:hypothetical protein
MVGFWRDGKTWGRASTNTFNCLIGFSIGDFGMFIYMRLYHLGLVHIVIAEVQKENESELLKHPEMFLALAPNA